MVTIYDIENFVRGITDSENEMIHPFILGANDMVQFGTKLRKFWENSGGFADPRDLCDIMFVRLDEHAIAV